MSSRRLHFVFIGWKRTQRLMRTPWIFCSATITDGIFQCLLQITMRFAVFLTCDCVGINPKWQYRLEWLACKIWQKICSKTCCRSEQKLINSGELTFLSKPKCSGMVVGEGVVGLGGFAHFATWTCSNQSERATFRSKESATTKRKDSAYHQTSAVAVWSIFVIVCPLMKQVKTNAFKLITFKRHWLILQEASTRKSIVVWWWRESVGR